MAESSAAAIPDKSPTTVMHAAKLCRTIGALLRVRSQRDCTPLGLSAPAFHGSAKPDTGYSGGESAPTEGKGQAQAS